MFSKIIFLDLLSITYKKFQFFINIKYTKTINSSIPVKGNDN